MCGLGGGGGPACAVLRLWRCCHWGARLSKFMKLYTLCSDDHYVSKLKFMFLLFIRRDFLHFALAVANSF